MNKSTIASIIFFVAMAATTTIIAQDSEAMKKIESIRIALITESLGLSPEQAREFWPVYNEYTQHKRALRVQLVEAGKNMNPQTISEQESKQLMELRLTIKEKELNLEKKYTLILMSVISSRQILELRNAENDFRRRLLQEVFQRNEQQRRQQLNQERMRQRQEYLRKKGNN